MREGRALLQQILSRVAFPPDAFRLHDASRGRKIIVYGAGEAFHYFEVVVMDEYGYRPAVVLDRKFRAGDTFAGAPAFSPEDYRPSDEEKLNGLVVVCLGKQRYYEEVVATLRGLGFQHIIPLSAIYEVHNPFRLPAELEQEGFDWFRQRSDRILAAYDLMADDQSRAVYVKCVQTHLERKPVPVSMCARGEQYLPQGVPLTKGYQRFIYCGISVGDIIHIMGTTGPLEEVVFFEADPNQYRNLVAHLEEKGGTYAKRVTAIPCAVCDREGIVPFTYSDTSFGSRIVSTGKASVQCVSIDHALPGFGPTFMSMDIEGAELEALKGAEKTIRSSRPDLGICVYHAPHHLWDIPLYLESLGLGYRFFMRNYTSLNLETVLYATM